jgi:hypothetical protein
MAIVVKLSQVENAVTPIVVTLFGMVIDCNLRHPSKAESPIFVTLFGSVISVKLGHS